MDELLELIDEKFTRLEARLAALEAARGDGDIAHGPRPVQPTSGQRRGRLDAAPADPLTKEQAREQEITHLMKMGLTKEEAEKQMDEREREAQSKADSAYQTCGLGRAPGRLEGESLLGYKRRLARGLQSRSPKWSTINLNGVNDNAMMDIACSEIYADSVGTVTGPEAPGSGILREVTTTDRAGRVISEFHGDPLAAWRPFMHPGKRLIGVNTKSAAKR